MTCLTNTYVTDVTAPFRDACQIVSQLHGLTHLHVRPSHAGVSSPHDIHGCTHGARNETPRLHRARYVYGVPNTNVMYMMYVYDIYMKSFIKFRNPHESVKKIGFGVPNTNVTYVMYVHDEIPYENSAIHGNGSKKSGFHGKTSGNGL